VTDSDYFSLFGLPRKLEIHLEELQHCFYELSRKHHPDFFMSAAPDEQARALEQSALINRAYRTLRDPISRVEYLIDIEEEGGAAIQPKAPMDLLEESLELQELLTEAKADGVDAAARQRLAEERQRLSERRAQEEQVLLTLARGWDAFTTERNGDRRKLVERFKQHLAALAYLGTVIDDLSEALGEETHTDVSHRRH
jgi:molecular chaperone HscB